MTHPKQPQPYPGDGPPATYAQGAAPATTRPEQPQPYPGDGPPVTYAEGAAPVTTRPEQPAAYPGDALLPGMVQLRRVYRDPLGRPLSGQVTLLGATRHTHGGAVVPPTPVTVTLVSGVLNVQLPPDTYQLSAQLRTVDGERATDRDTVTLA